MRPDLLKKVIDYIGEDSLPELARQLERRNLTSKSNVNVGYIDDILINDICCVEDEEGNLKAGVVAQIGLEKEEVGVSFYIDGDLEKGTDKNLITFLPKSKISVMSRVSILNSREFYYYEQLRNELEKGMTEDQKWFVAQALEGADVKNIKEMNKRLEDEISHRYHEDDLESVPRGVYLRAEEHYEGFTVILNRHFPTLAYVWAKEKDILKDKSCRPY